MLSTWQLSKLTAVIVQTSWQRQNSVYLKWLIGATLLWYSVRGHQLTPTYDSSAGRLLWANRHYNSFPIFLNPASPFIMSNTLIKHKKEVMLWTFGSHLNVIFLMHVKWETKRRSEGCTKMSTWEIPALISLAIIQLWPVVECAAATEPGGRQNGASLLGDGCDGSSTLRCHMHTTQLM